MSNKTTGLLLMELGWRIRKARDNLKPLATCKEGEDMLRRPIKTYPELDELLEIVNDIQGHAEQLLDTDRGI